MITPKILLHLELGCRDKAKIEIPSPCLPCELMGISYWAVMLVVTLFTKEGEAVTVAGFLINLLICAGAGMLGGMIS